MRQSFELDEDVVVLSAPFDPGGSVAREVNNKIVVFLANISKDTLPTQNSYTMLDKRSGLQTASPLFLNLHVMVAACFDSARYQESLKFTSHAIRYFQENPIIDRNTNPELEDGLDKLVLDIENVAAHELSNLWGILGSRYLPSVLYKVRMVVINNNAVTRRNIKTTTPETRVGA